MSLLRRLASPIFPGVFLSPVAVSRAALQALSCALLFSARAADIPSPIESTDLTELPLEALMEMEVPKVYSASKFEQRVTDAPSSVSVVPSEEIKRYGHRTLADVLASVQSLHVSYDRNYSFLGARGISLGDFNSRILLLVDGHRVNNNLTDGAYLGTEFILDVDLIDRVEIIRGPGSVLYGNNAFFGVVNVITRQGKDLNGLEVAGSYGSFDTFQGRASYGRSFKNGLQCVLSGTYYNSHGVDDLYYPEFDTPQQNNGVAEGMDGDTYASGFGSISYGDFRFEGAYNRREKVNPTAQYPLTTFNDSRLRTTDQRGYANLRYAHSFEDVVDVSTQVYYDANTYEIGYPQSLYVGTNQVFSGYSTEEDRGQWWGTELQLNKRLWERHLITLGAEYRDDFLQEKHVSGQPTVETDRHSYGIFAQGEFMVLTNLHLNGGVRYDYYTSFDPAWNPRVAVIYHPFETSTLKAISGTAFRAPNFMELSDSRFQDIAPEEITSYELVYEQQVGQHLRSSVSGFYNDMDDLIVFSSGSFTNFDAQARGLEFALEGFWTNGIRGRVSYALQDAENDSVAWDLPDSPTHTVKLNLSVPLWKEKIFAGVEFQYLSERRSLHTTTLSGQPVTVQGEEAGGFTVVNLTLFSRELVKNLEFSASVYNLFNTSYADPATRFHQQDLLERDGRTFRVKLAYRF
jgi:iron complex outermembrane receptor protein